MATLHQVLSAVQSQVIGVTTGLQMFDAPLTVQVGIGWPPVNTLQQGVKMQPPGALVSVFDRRRSRDTTRWVEAVVAQTVTPATLTSSPSSQPLLPGGSVQVTLGGTVTPGDAVSLVVYNRGALSGSPADGSAAVAPAAAEVVAGGALDTPGSLAAALSAAVAADPAGAGAWVTASASGPVVTVTNKLPSAVVVSSYTGNGGVNTTEIGRRDRDVQITVWSPSPEIRDIVGDPVEVLIAQIELFRAQYQAGLTLADGSFGRLTALNDMLVDDGALSDIYRRDFVVCVDYPITVMDSLYSVLAPIQSYNITA